MGVGFFAGGAGLGVDGEVAGEPDEGCVFGGCVGFVVVGDVGVVAAGDGAWFGEAAPIGVPAEAAGGATGSALGAGVSATSSIQADP